MTPRVHQWSAHLAADRPPCGGQPTSAPVGPRDSADRPGSKDERAILITPGSGGPSVRAEGELELELDGSQIVLTVEVRPGGDGAEGLIGHNAIRGLSERRGVSTATGA